jgi:hypothetical protein
MKNSTKFLGILILAAASFCMLACPTDGGGDGVRDDGKFSLATLKTPEDVKSTYLSDIPVKSKSRAAAGSDTISSLSYISSTGQNAPVLFSTPTGKKQFIFDVTNVEQLGERCIIITITGYYEVTSTGAAGSYTVGDKVSTEWDNEYWDEKTETMVKTTRIDSVLIDMKNSKLYDFSEFEPRNSSPPWPVRFMEGDIIYTAKDTYSNGTVYKIDLSTASVDSALQAVPLNNSAFMPITSISLPYTINNKLIGNKTQQPYSGAPHSETTMKDRIISLDVSGAKTPETYKPQEQPFVNIFNTNVLVRDLTGKPWAFTTAFSNGNYTYSTAEVSIDDQGQCTLSSKNNDTLSFSYSNNEIIFTFNAVGTGSTIIDNAWSKKKMRSFLNNGVVTLYSNGFVRLRQEVDGIKVESAGVTLPTSLAGKSVISSENYLFWLEDKTIKRQKLEAGSSAQDVYSNSGIMDIVSTRDLLTASGRKIIFYQYAAGSATEVHTYSLDMYIPGAQPELLATNDAEVRSIVELDF